MARHRSFSTEFKRQLAKEFLDGCAGLHELARRHSLSRNLIRLWVRKYETGEFTDEMAEAVQAAEYERKIAELERKVGQLTMEVDLLKKGAQLGRQPNEGRYSIVSGPKPFALREDVESRSWRARRIITVAARWQIEPLCRTGSLRCAPSFHATATDASRATCGPRGR